MVATDPASVGGGKESGGDGCVADETSDDRIQGGEFVQVHLGVEQVLAGNVAPPEPMTLLAVGVLEIDDELEPAKEGGIDALPQVGGQDRQPLEPFKRARR